MKWWKSAGQPIEDWTKQRREVKGLDVSSWFDTCGKKPPEVVEVDATIWLAELWKTKHENAEGSEFKQFCDKVIATIECSAVFDTKDEAYSYAKQNLYNADPLKEKKPPEGVPIDECATARRYAVLKKDMGLSDIKSAPLWAEASFFKAARAPIFWPGQINTQLWVREVLGTDFISKRTLDWFEFAGEVARHTENYAVAQYGDEADGDAANDYTVDYCFRQVKKYIERFGRNQRPGQQELDFLKMAHYIQLAMGCYNDEKKNN